MTAQTATIERRMAPGQLVRNVLEALLQEAQAKLAGKFQGRGFPVADAGQFQISMDLRIPETDGSTKILRTTVALLLSPYAGDGDEARVSIVPEVSAEVFRERDGLRWLVPEDERRRDLVRLVFEVQEVLDTLRQGPSPP